MGRTDEFPRRTVLAGATGLLGAGCLGAATERTPGARDDDWRMYGRDPGRTRYVPDADLPREGVDIAWEREGGSRLPPVVADGTVYCQHSNGLFVLDRDTGEGTDVTTSSNSSVMGSFGRNAGPMAFGSTTAYRDGVLVVPYDDTLAGYAADPDGWPDAIRGLGRTRARWWTDGERTETNRSWFFSAEQGWHSPPLVADGRLVSVHPSGSVSVVDVDDGSQQWRYDLASARPGLSRPSLHDHVVDVDAGIVAVSCTVVDEDSRIQPLLVGIDLESGTLEWVDYDEPEGDRRAESGLWSSHPANSLAASDGTVYVAERGDAYSDRELVELDAATGDRGWSLSLERSDHVGLALDETTVYHVGLYDDGLSGPDQFRLVALERDGGAVRWDVSLDDAPGGMSLPFPPTVAGGLVLVPGGKGLHALDRESGDRLWTFTEMVGTAGGGDTERTARTPAVVSDDRIVIGMSTKLYGLE